LLPDVDDPVAVRNEHIFQSRRVGAAVVNYDYFQTPEILGEDGLQCFAYISSDPVGRDDDTYFGFDLSSVVHR
jgi:hypothetical protein